jgi:DNA-binding NarL/FixJ family response regulator
MKMKILIVDDHSIVREGLQRIIQSQQDMTVVGESKHGREAVSQAETLRPDVVIMDISMPMLNGIEATRAIHLSLPSARIIILSMHHTAEYVYRAMHAGACGYILKESAGTEIVEAIRIVMTGKNYFGQGIEMQAEAANAADNTDSPSPIDRLSKREREVLQLVVEGNTSIKIAQILGLSPKSVETYRSRMMQKLGVTDIPSLVKFAVQHGITPPT